MSCYTFQHNIIIINCDHELLERVCKAPLTVNRRKKVVKISLKSRSFKKAVPCGACFRCYMLQTSPDANYKSLCERPNVEKEQKKYKEIQPINQFRLARLMAVMQPVDLHVNSM